MPFYVEVDETGARYADRPDRYFNPPLVKEEVETYKNGQPKIVPLEFQAQSYDQANFKSIGFVYDRLDDGSFVKREHIVELSDEEKRAIQDRATGDAIESALPHWTKTDLLMLKLLKGLYDWKEANFSKDDPGFGIGEPTEEEWQTLNQALAIHKIGRERA